MDDKLPAKTAKFKSLKNLYVYGVSDYEEVLQKFKISQEPFCFASDGELL